MNSITDDIKDIVGLAVNFFANSIEQSDPQRTRCWRNIDPNPAPGGQHFGRPRSITGFHNELDCRRIFGLRDNRETSLAALTARYGKSNTAYRLGHMKKLGAALNRKGY
jgi:hypothetical protein